MILDICETHTQRCVCLQVLERDRERQSESESEACGGCKEEGRHTHALIHAYTHARHSYTRTFTEREGDGVHASACMQCVNEPACQCVPVRERDRETETETERGGREGARA